MGTKILIVEDDPDISFLLQEELRGRFKNARIDVIPSPRNAISAIEENNYDIVISDIGLRDPWLGGDAVLNCSKQHNCFTVQYSGSNKICPTCDFNLPKVLSESSINVLYNKYKEFCSSSSYLKQAEGVFMKNNNLKKLKKAELKKQLREIGLLAVGNYIRKKDIISAMKRIVAETTPAVYVGTYGKYNSGSINGKWLNLEDYASKEDFYEAAKELHKDEADPELMFQDFEGFPKRYYGESSLSDELWDWLELSEEDRELLEVYVDDTGDTKATIDQARDAFLGTYDSEEDWAEEYLEEIGGLTADNVRSYLEMTDTDKRIISGEEADNFVENEDDDSILDYADMEDEYADEEDEAKKEKILEKAKDEALSRKSDEVEKALDDPIGYFVDDVGAYTVEDLIKAPFVYIDYKSFAKDASLGGDISFVRKDGKVWVFSNH